MQTVYLENRGRYGFVQHALPLEAQYAPVYGITVIDANNDGKKDLYLPAIICGPALNSAVIAPITACCCLVMVKAVSLICRNERVAIERRR